MSLDEDAVEIRSRPLWRRHPVLAFVLGFTALLGVIAILQHVESDEIAEWVNEYSWSGSYLIVFLLVAGDAIIPIFPGETTLNAASALAAEGELELGLVMLAGALGAIVGDQCLFWIARLSSARVQPQLDKAMRNPKIRTAWEMMDRSAPLLIVAGRFVPGMRFAVNVTMGLSDLPYRRFLPWSIVGGVVWSVYTCGLAYLVATTLSGYPLASIIVSGLVTTAAIAAIFLVVRRRRKGGDGAGEQEAIGR
jgi:membrane protein DedA with SNARE-associated domain